MSSFYIGVAGMKAQSSAIEQTSANVSNASTAGYKGYDYLFVDQFFRQMQTNYGNSSVDGSARRSGTQGNVRASSSPLDLAIDGAGMFRLSSQTAGDAGQAYFTRNGQFSVDKDGYLVNQNGLYLTGYQATSDYTSVGSRIAALKLPPSPVSPMPSQDATVEVNLDSRKAAIVDDPARTPPFKAPAFSPSDTSSYSSATTVRVFDSKGDAHTVTVYFRRIEDTPPAEAVNDPRPGAAAGSKAVATQYEVYGAVDGIVLSHVTPPQAGGSAFPLAAAAVDETSQPGPFKPITTLQFVDGRIAKSFQRDKASGDPISPTKMDLRLRDLAGGDLVGVNFDLSDTTAYGSTFEVRRAEADGYAPGALTGITFDEQGRMLAQYSNGKLLVGGQLVLATFGGEGQLVEASSNVYAETFASGAPLLGTATSAQYGAIRGGSIEESNIDLSQELVRLMIQQRNYQANAQSVKTADELLTTTIQLGR